MSTFSFDSDPGLFARMKVFGVGGAGKNALNHMIEAGVPGVEFVVANTDAQDLAESNAKHKIQLGHEITRGLGAGADPEIGKKAAEDSRDEIAEHLADIDMVFITAGMGGGTGSGAAPVIAEIARELGVLTVGVVTKPFSFEGPKRATNAESGLAAFKEHVDTVVVIPNQKLKEAVSRNTTFKEALKVADEVLLQATRGISDLITFPGLINVDFADIKTTMENKGAALMGTGDATGENRAKEAAERAMSHPLLEDLDIDGAKDILLNITGGQDLTLFDVDEAMTTIQEAAGHTNVIMGTVLDESLEGALRVTLIATGLDQTLSSREDMTARNIVKFRNELPNELETPTFKRVKRSGPKITEEPSEGNPIVEVEEEDELDVPTYMRRRRSFGS
ncbi:MAG: cell division protein FtsZ [Candidatus Latescibacteria bacterium]|jgi:cell division protein FtsZ|nr:cell division protein FtsZ [Candidatus Latescibacterota bacterium]